MQPTDPSRPAEGLVPYGLNAPFWSDGAAKERWFALPDGTTIDVEADGDWTLPVGAVAVKQFRLDGKPVETRLLARDADGGVSGYSYAWLPDGSDALLLRGRESREVAGQTWSFPSPADCQQCHTDAAGGFIGLETAQQNGTHPYPAAVANQVLSLDHVGLFTASPGAPDDLPALPDPLGDADVDARARAWLHSNCAGCHRPNGGGGGALDLRWQTPLADLGACDLPPDGTDLGVTGAVLLAPGAPERSLISLRAHDRATAPMPPIASHLPDTAGLAVLDAWISGLTACP